MNYFIIVFFKFYKKNIPAFTCLEWSETDESGGVRQITQIKTETSIKLEGDGEF